MSIIKQSVERTCGSFVFANNSDWIKMVVDHVQDISNAIIGMDIGFTQYSANIVYTTASNNPYVILKHTCGSLYLMISVFISDSAANANTYSHLLHISISNSPLFAQQVPYGPMLSNKIYFMQNIALAVTGNSLFRTFNIVCYKNDVNNFVLRFTPYNSKTNIFNFLLMESQDFSNNKLPMILTGTTFMDAVSAITTPATLGTISGAIVSGASGVSIYGYGIIRECQFYNAGYIQCKKILNLYDYLGDGTIVAGGLYTIGDSNYLAISTTLLYKY